MFVTGKDTRKYKNISNNKNVALLIDSRKNEISDFKNASAITAIGIAQEPKGEENDRFVEIYLGKHPYLAEFLYTSHSTLISVMVTDYIIADFNKSRQIRVGEYTP